MPTAQKIQVLDIQLKTEPGSLNKVFSALREAKVNVDSCWAYQMGPTEAQCHVITREYDKARKALKEHGYTPKEAWVCWAEGDDKVGTYQDLLQKVYKAGVNIEATAAFALEGRFGTIFWVREKDYPTLCKTLGC